MNYPLFGNGLSGFSNNLQGAPHAVVHNFIGQNMATYFSPDDPLFMLHHCNIDRIWALYQDYYNHDLIPKDALTWNQYSGGRGIGLDDPLPYLNGTGAFGGFFLLPSGRAPTPRDMHHSCGGLVNVTYTNDYLGLLLSKTDPAYAAYTNSSWFELATGPVAEISCSTLGRRLEETSGNLSITEASSILGIAKDVPPWSNITTRLMWDNLTAEGMSANDALNTIAYRDCQATGNQLLASPAWIAMHGMQNWKDLFRCFNRGNPGDCVPETKIVSNDVKFIFNYNPVDIVNYNETSVSFTLSQVWTSSTVDLIAVQYTTVEGFDRCEVSTDVFPGEFGIYNTRCVDGSAAVKVYAHDQSFPASASAGFAADLCSSGGVAVPLTRTHAHSVTIPCSLTAPQCPLPVASEPICDGTSRYAVATDSFDTPSDASSWIYSKTRKSAELGTYLVLNQGTSKTYRVPRTANNLTVTLELFQLNCTSTQSMNRSVSVHVNDRWVELGWLGCQAHDPMSLEADDIVIAITSEAATVDKVVLGIPPSFFKDSGRLTLGLRNPLIGIGSVSILADCSDSVPIWKAPEVVDIIAQVNGE